jgi:hypothetical protein
LTLDVEHGEAVAALPTHKRAFVLALMSDPGNVSPVEAARIAGIDEKQAVALIKDRQVIAALKELGADALFASVPLAVKTLRDVMGSTFSKDRYKATEAVLNRVAPIVQKIEMKAEVIDRTQVAIDHLKHLLDIGAGREALIREFGELSLERYEALLAARSGGQAIPMKTIEATPEEPERSSVAADIAPLEGIDEIGDWENL